MNELIRMENIAIAEISGERSFSIIGGGLTVLVTPKYEINAALTRLMIGMEIPCSGKVFLFNSDTSALSRPELLQNRCRIGIVSGSGGLVSNLKAWENITLPLYFHYPLSHAEIKERGLAVLSRLGFTANLMVLPALLTFSQRKLIGMARAMLMDPDVMIYESPDSGLNQEEKNNYFRIAREFHREKLERASVFITSNQELVQFLPEAEVVDLTKVTI